MLDTLSILKTVIRNAVDPIELIMEFVVTQLEGYKLKDQEAGSEPETQSKNRSDKTNLPFLLSKLLKLFPPCRILPFYPFTFLPIYLFTHLPIYPFTPSTHLPTP